MMKALYYKTIIASLLLAYFGVSCSKDTTCINAEKAELKNLTGLDGCGWVIVLEDKTTLEPINLDSFNIQKSEGKKVWVSYQEVSAGSICMVGKTVRIDCISER